jgi:hypothetical protein
MSAGGTASLQCTLAFLQLSQQASFPKPPNSCVRRWKPVLQTGLQTHEFTARQIPKTFFVYNFLRRRRVSIARAGSSAPCQIQPASPREVRCGLARVPACRRPS